VKRLRFQRRLHVGQGNKTTILIADLQAGYLVNPATNLKVFAVIFIEILILLKIQQLPLKKVQVGSLWFKNRYI
jgi:hypothetical protein